MSRRSGVRRFGIRAPGPRSSIRAAFVLLLLLAGGPAPALDAQQSARSEAEERARLQRRGAGVRVGVWDVRGLSEVADAEYSRTPLFEGYFQHGLDRHLALQNSVGFWRRSQEIEVAQIGGSRRESVQSYVIPQFTSLRFFPVTGPDQALEPFVEGGAGISLGIDDRSTTSGGPLGLGSGDGIAVVVGFGFKLGLGTEWRFSRALGLAAGGRYQWIRFLDDLGGERTYRGFGAEMGLTYRFQYD